jgi:hypothetical protein
MSSKRVENNDVLMSTVTETERFPVPFFPMSR